jgi:hypothetical protein
MYRYLTSIHTVLAAFFLPMGVMYAVTGGLYGLDIKGDYKTTDHAIPLTEPLPADLAGLVAVADAELKRLGIEPPSGRAGVRKTAAGAALDWTGSRRDIELAPTADPARAVLKVKDTTAHRFFVQLHKAKGGDAFRYFAAVWMVGLVLLFLTGGVMAFFAKKYRPLAIVSSAAGVIAFVALAWVS